MYLSEKKINIYISNIEILLYKLTYDIPFIKKRTIDRKTINNN